MEKTNSKDSSAKVKKSETKRRKAVFSCDRCKTRKRKCVRFTTNEDNEKIPTFDIIYPCQECIQSNSICYTYLGQRKQTTLKNLTVSENLISKENPEKNVNFKIKELEVKCQYLTNLLKQISPNIKTELFKDDENTPKSISESSISSLSNENSKSLINEESNIIDNSSPSNEAQFPLELKNSDQIKPMISTNLHDTVIELIGSPSSLKSLSSDIGQSITGESLLGDYDLKLKSYDNNQLVYTIPRNEADLYVCEYFDRIHPICNCIDKEEFVRIYELFWLLLQHEDLRSINSVLFLSTPQICTIYLIWILGKKFKNPNDLTLVNSYLKIIEKTLSDIILNPSESGIQMEILFSYYLESTQSRENAWILIETAVTQAITIGINKNDKKLFKKFNEKHKSYSKIWCTLLFQEVRLSNVMGKQSSIDSNEIDIITPKFKQIQTSNLPKYWIFPINYNDYQLYFDNYFKLTKIFHEFLKYRSSIMEDNLIYNVKSIQKAWELRSKFHNWIQTLPKELKNIFDQEPSRISTYKVHLHLTYHYYFINLGLPFLMLILRMIQSERKIKMKNSDPIYILAVSAVNCSKQLHNIIKYEFDNKIFNGSVYNDIYILYHSLLIFTVAIVVVSNKEVNLILDSKQLEVSNLTVDKLWNIIYKIGELNKQLQPLTSGSNLEISKTIDLLVENVSTFLKNNKEENTKENDEKNDENLHTPTSFLFNNKVNDLFNTGNLNNDELWKMINQDYIPIDDNGLIFKEFNELDNYFTQ